MRKHKGNKAKKKLDSKKDWIEDVVMSLVKSRIKDKISSWRNEMQMKKQVEQKSHVS